MFLYSILYSYEPNRIQQTLGLPKALSYFCNVPVRAISRRDAILQLPPRSTVVFETQINVMRNCVIGELRVKTVATRCQILRCTKFDFDCGSVPDPAGGAYSAPPDPLAGYKGATSLPTCFLH